MRFFWAAVALTALGAAQAATGDYQRLWAPYRAQLAAQCPAKHLDLLSPAALRDALDAYKSDASPGLRRAMAQAEAQECAHVTAGATCANVGDIVTATRAIAWAGGARTGCGRFAGCREQSDCNAVEMPGDAGLARMLKRAAAGDEAALRAAASLRARTDGELSESIDAALSDALQTNPGAVLRLLHADATLPRPAWLCEDRAIEPSAVQIARYCRRALRAVAMVRNPALRPLRDACLVALRRAT